MPSKRSFLSLIAFVALPFLVSCGVVQEPDVPKIPDIKYLQGDCFKGMDLKIEAYVRGEISQRQWAETWKCAGETLKLLEFTTGKSQGNVYSAEQIQGVLNQFWFSEHPVSMEFVLSFTSLKASLWGGQFDHVSQGELQRIAAFLDTLGIETARLIPLLRKISGEPSKEDLMAFLTEVEKSSRAIAAHFRSSKPRYSYPNIFLRTLLSELESRWHLDWPDADQLLRLKAILAGGSKEWVEPSLWSALLPILSKASAIHLLTSKSPKNADESENELYRLELVSQVRNLLSGAVALHPDGIPLEDIQEWFDELEWPFPIHKNAVRPILEALVNKVFRSAKENRLDSHFLDQFYEYVEGLVLGSVHVRSVLDTGELDSENFMIEDFSAAALLYARRLKPRERQRVFEIIELGRQNVGLFQEYDSELDLNRRRTYSRKDLTEIYRAWLTLTQLVKAYSFRQDRLSLSLIDFRKLIADFGPVMRQTGWLAADESADEKMIFMEMEAFGNLSQADGFLDAFEWLDWLRFYRSSLSFQARASGPLMQACGTEIKRDCASDYYFSSPDFVWSHFGGLSRYFEALSSDEKEHFSQTLMNSVVVEADEGFKTEELSRINQTQTFVETMLIRFDQNHDGVLENSEAREAFPSLLATIAMAAGDEVDRDDLDELEAFYTYLLEHEEYPWEDPQEYLYWKLISPFWDIQADRTKLIHFIRQIRFSPKR